MKAKKVLLVLMVCALAFLVFAAPADAKSKGTERPFKGSLSGGAVFLPGSLADPPLPESPSPFGIYTISHARGNVSHLGNTTMYSYHPTPGGTEIEDGLMTLTAANGDKVYIEYDGYAPLPELNGVPNTVHITGHFWIAGGTGRFVGATGEADYTAEVVCPGFLGGTDPWPGVWHWAGWISY